MTTMLLQAASPGWLPPDASSTAKDVDYIFIFIFVLCALFFALIVGVTIYFVVKYRKRPGMRPLPSASHNTKLEILWSAIPTALLLVIFAAGTTVYLKMQGDGKDAPEVTVTARKWSWWFDHPEGKGSAQLHLIMNEPVRLVMSSPDVLHSLSIPAFRVKQDVVPGRYTKVWVKPTQAGNFPIYCTEYCGTNHSQMLSEVVVHADRASYDEWANFKIDESLPLEEVGKMVYGNRGCSACHSVDGTRGAGPSFKGLFGKVETFTDGSKLTVDENYIRESIVAPKAKIVRGFGPVMPALPLEEREFLGIIAYIKSLKD